MQLIGGDRWDLLLVDAWHQCTTHEAPLSAPCSIWIALATQIGLNNNPEAVGVWGKCQNPKAIGRLLVESICLLIEDPRPYLFQHCSR